MKKGFTLIELIVVVAIIGILSSIGVVTYREVSKKARDAKRLSDMNQIRLALEMYYDSNGHYPENTDNDCGGWDTGFNGGQGSGDPFIQLLETSGLMSKTPGDPISTENCGGYSYYRYGAGNGGCDVLRGPFFVLGVRNMETSGNPHPSSPGWSCASRGWQIGFDWVTGGFER